MDNLTACDFCQLKVRIPVSVIGYQRPVLPSSSAESSVTEEPEGHKPH